MADRYPNRPFPADGYDRGGDQYGSGGNETDPLAELARLIGQTDPFAAPGRANTMPAQPPREQYQPRYQEPVEEDEPAPASPPQWMQRANIQRQQAGRQAPSNVPYAEPDEYPSQDYQGQDQDYQGQDYAGRVHPLHRHPAQSDTHQPDGYAAAYDQAEDPADPSRYDDALYGQIESGAQDFHRDPAYPDDPYAYQDGYEEEEEEQPTKRRGGLFTVTAVLALAVVGTGAAFAYRTYVGSPRSGDPPIIKADNSPTKIIPASSDASNKTPDRMPTGDGAEKIVPREETPVDVNSRAAGPRVVFPPLNANNNPPSPASVSPSEIPPLGSSAGAATPSNGTMPNSEPRKIKTFTVRGDQPDSAAPVAAAPATIPAKPTAATKQAQRTGAASAAGEGNAPLSLAPDSASAQASLPPAPSEPRTRVAATAPTQLAPSTDSPSASEGRFLVQVSSQGSETDAQASFRSLQKKYPDQLGSRSPIIKRFEDSKGTHYRALVGPFASRDEAARFCTSYRTAGGQCWIP